ncbi:MAG: hypothetical protein V4547_16445 [Bacteroidota bacterium]
MSDNNNPDEIELKHFFKDLEDYKSFLNKAPKKSWTKTRDLSGGRKSTYLPFPYQQALADKIFREFDVIREHYDLFVNEMMCTVTIQYLPDYPHAEQRIMTGTAFKPAMMEAGSAASKFPVGKITNSLEYNGPNARSAAISNALMTLGNVFGRNLSRKDFAANYQLEEKKKDEQP